LNGLPTIVRDGTLATDPCGEAHILGIGGRAFTAV